MTLPLPQTPRPLPDMTPNVLSAALGDEESEAAILGGLMCSGEPDKPNKAFALLSDLTHKSFINLKHQYIWRAMQILAQDNQPIDLITVKNQLKLVSTESQNFYELVGETYLKNLIRMQGDSPLAYKKILEYAEWRRALFQVGAQLQKISVNGSQHISKAMDQVTQILNELQIQGMNLLSGQATNLKDEIEEFNETFGEETDRVSVAGWPTGFREFDRYFRGFQKERLYLVGGLPGAGKSTLVMNFSRALLNAGARVFTLSLEMMVKEMLMRIIVMETGIELYKIEEKRMNAAEIERFNESMARLAQHQGSSQFYLKYEDMPTLTKLKAIIQQAFLINPFDVLIVDYAGWELIAPDNPNGKFDPSFHMSNIMGFLKDLAKELKIPVITPVQMKAAFEKSGGTPMMSDIEWSHTAGKRADGIILLHEETPYSEALGHGCTIARIVKNRGGGRKDVDVKLESRPHLFTFNDWRE